ncbi:MAG TPA: hypothetical protein VE821_07505, partial [Pyrinomonadaceae bacterium]|nr:hypothetical protein [Pyrinomonadaceae bacterium]
MVKNLMRRAGDWMAEVREEGKRQRAKGKRQKLKTAAGANGLALTLAVSVAHFCLLPFAFCLYLFPAMASA